MNADSEAGTRAPAWTYSQLDAFESCPKKFWHLKVIRDVVEPPTVHTTWGKAVHSGFESYIQNGELLPDGMKQWQPLATKLGRLPGEKLVEQQYAIDRNFQPAPWGQAWSRGIADLVVLHKNKGAVLDYKTGKRKPTEQLALYANYLFHHYPQLDKVITGFVWLQSLQIDWSTYTRHDTPIIWQHLLPRIQRLEAAHASGHWPEKPSGLCRGWCPVKTCSFYQDK